MRNLKSDNRGNVAIMTGFLAVLLFGLGGAGVDFVRFTSVRSEVQSAADSAVLAASSLTNPGNPVDIATDYFNSNFDNSRYNIEDLSVTPQLNVDTASSRQVTMQVTGDLPTLFLKIFDLFTPDGDSLQSLAIDVNAVAAQESNRIELVLVLDVSNSMDGPKLTSLIEEAQNFIDVMFDNSASGTLSMSIIPFSANVNVEPIIDQFADLSGEVLPLAKPCITYEPSDYAIGIPSVDRPLVIQADGGRGHGCDVNPIILNSADPDSLKALIRDITTTLGTDSHVALQWGLRVLSPAMRGNLGGDFPDRPRNFGANNTLKVIVMMSDGKIFPLISGFPGTDPVAVTEATLQFNGLCGEARANGVLVFSIGFDIASGSDADIMLRDCASNLSQYYFVEGLDLASTFSGIAASLSKLRIVE